MLLWARCLASELKSGKWDQILCPFARDLVDFFSEDELAEAIRDATGVPVRYSIWLDVYWTTHWAKSLSLARVQTGSSVLEIGAGVSTSFVRACNHVIGSNGYYKSLNLNAELSRKFLKRTEVLSIPISIVQDNALNAPKHLAKDLCGFVGFNHQINDIIQTILYEQEGLSTLEKPWAELRPEMVKRVMKARESLAKQTGVRSEFVQIIAACVHVLRKGGWIGFNNAVIPIDLAAGYTADVMLEFIPLVRSWLTEDLDNIQLETPEGFDERWWLFFSKTEA